jgi:hypothetical protein
MADGKAVQMTDVTRNYAKLGEPSDPQERKGAGHDGQPQPPEAAPPAPANLTVNTDDDPLNDDPLAGLPVPKSDDDIAVGDADERTLKPVLHTPNNRVGGG